ncbi:MAG: response regulator [Verrucomicrobia bacterium]|nr:response regulator [Verrucomicrobiota bacterium]MDA1088016.1 response regulator [Verrucomicrobiota bacterium]
MESLQITQNDLIGRAGHELQRIRVLLIEDNLGFAYFIRETLSNMEPSFEVTRTSCLSDGLASLAKASPDLILLDLGLPDSRRIDTFDRLHLAEPTVPVIVLTVLDDDAVAREAIRKGAQDYLVKDRVDKDLLVRSIHYAIERSRSDRELRRLSADLLTLQDEERRRIARDLHDVTAQDIAALSMNLTLLAQSKERLAPELNEIVRQCIVSTEKCATELRTMSYLLHPPLLDELGLAGAVRDYADGFAERSGIRVDLELPEDLDRLPKECETGIFRVMQESLTNIHRHASSRTASIQISKTDTVAKLIVQDSGCGISEDILAGAAGASGSLGVGLPGMRERVHQLRGKFEITSGAHGTTVIAAFPITPDEPCAHRHGSLSLTITTPFVPGCVPYWRRNPAGPSARRQEMVARRWNWRESTTPMSR